MRRRAEVEQPRIAARSGVEALNPSVSGPLSLEAVARVTARHLGEVERCHLDALRDQPALAGQVRVRAIIQGNGSVLAASRSDGPDALDGVAACVVAKVRRWRFSDVEGGAVAQVVMPFVFHASRR